MPMPPTNGRLQSIFKFVCVGQAITFLASHSRQCRFVISEARLEMFENEKAPLLFAASLFLPNPKQMQRKSVVNVNSVAGRSPSGGSCVIHRFSRESWQNLRGTHPT